MGSPAIFSGRRTKLLTPDGLLLGSGVVVDNDGELEYIKNGHAEINANGWSIYKDAAGTKPNPTSGGGGSPTVTWTRSTTNPLAGVGSFLFTKPASNTQGEGVSYDFTISNKDKAKVLTVSFDYIVESGTFAAGTGTTDSDLTVWLYDVTNDIVIQPTSYKLLSASSSTPAQFKGNFQTSTATSYRLIIHSGTTVTNAFVLKFDNLSVKTCPYIYGSPVLDAVAYTPAFSNLGTVTNVSMKYKRIGDSVQIFGNFTAGTTVAAIATMTLPPGLSIDSTKISALTLVGYSQRAAADARNFGILANGGDTFLTFSAQGSSDVGLTSQNGNALTSSGVTHSFFCQVPITSYSSSVVMSSDAETRVIVASGTLSNNFSGTAALNMTALVDTISGLASNTYTVQVSGVYRIDGRTYGVSSVAGGQTHGVLIYKNGAEVARSANYTTDINPHSDYVTYMANFVAGDTIKFYGYTDVNTFNQTAANTNWRIERLTGPSQLASTESIACSAYIGGGSTLNAGDPINFNVKDFDSHGAFSTATYRFTAPSAGTYSVSGCAKVSSTTSFVIYKNGAAFKTAGGATSTTNGVFSATIKLLAGDYITVNTSAATNTTGGSMSGASVGNINIFRVGNY